MRHGYIRPVPDMTGFVTLVLLLLATGDSTMALLSAAKTANALTRSSRGVAMRLGTFAFTPHLAHSAYSSAFNYIITGPSPFSADCYDRGRWWKHEELWVISECLSFCECVDGVAKCTERRCSDNDRMPSPIVHLVEEDKRKEREYRRKERERRRRADARTRAEEGKYNHVTPGGHDPPENYFPARNAGGYFAREYVPPGDHVTGGEESHQSSESLDINNQVLGDDSFRSHMGAMFHPMFADSGMHNQIFQRSSDFDSARHIGNHQGDHSRTGDGNSAFRTSVSHQRAHESTQGTQFGREFHQGHRYNDGFYRTESYGNLAINSEGNSESFSSTG